MAERRSAPPDLRCERSLSVAEKRQRKAEWLMQHGIQHEADPAAIDRAFAQAQQNYRRTVRVALGDSSRANAERRRRDAERDAFRDSTKIRPSSSKRMQRRADSELQELKQLEEEMKKGAVVLEGAVTQAELMKIFDENDDFKHQIELKMDRYVYAKQQTQSLTVIFVVGDPASGKRTQCMRLHRSDPSAYPLISMREVFEDERTGACSHSPAAQRKRSISIAWEEVRSRRASN